MRSMNVDAAVLLHTKLYMMIEILRLMAESMKCDFGPLRKGKRLRQETLIVR